MASETVGWGTSETAILRTTDGGAMWSDVTPSGLPSRPVAGRPSLFYSEHFLDANAGLAIVPEGQDAGTLLITSNAGRTWDKVAVPFGFAQFSFVDARNGWAMAVRGVADGQMPVDIYRTTDGGKSWARVSGVDPGTPTPPGGLPIAGHKNGIVFHDLKTGWAAGFVPAAQSWLFITRDAGRTWQRQDLPLPPGFESSEINVEPPRLFGAKDGILLEAFYQPGQTPYLNSVFQVTHDGGETWQATTPFTGSAAYSFLDIAHGFALTSQPSGGASLLETRDSGRTWTTVPTNIAVEPVGMLQFVSERVGFAFGSGATESFLFKTTDAGRTWARLQPTVLSK